MRVMIHDKWKFPGGFYIFEPTGSQVNPDTPEGVAILKIITGKKQDKIDSNPKIDVSKEVTKGLKRKKKKKHWI